MGILSKSAIILVLLLAGNWAYAPVPDHKFGFAEPQWVQVTARITAYSRYEKNESGINHRGKRIKGEDTCAVPSNTFRDGTSIYIPVLDEMRQVNDRIPRKSVNKLKKRNKYIDIVIDLHYDESLKSKPKTKGIKRELIKKDLGIQKIWVYED